MNSLFFLILITETSLAISAVTEELKVLCEQKDGLACAKLGYQSQKSGDLGMARKYYLKGCDLGDQSACFNLKNTDSRDIYFEKMSKMMSFHHENFLNCYQSKMLVREPIKIDEEPSFSNFKKKIQPVKDEQWVMAEFKFWVDKDGVPHDIAIQGEDMEKFKPCAIEIIQGIQFPKSEYSRSDFRYKLPMRFTKAI